MRKTGKIQLCLLAMLAASVAIAAAGCDDGHTHTYSQAWAFDAQSHWHAATCSHDAKADESAHTFKDTVIAPSAGAPGYTLHTCDCGYSYTSDPTEPSPAEGVYRYNAEGHWTAIYGESAAVEPHQYTDETVASTCTTSGYTKHTCVCGYWYASDPTDPAPHTTDDSAWEHDSGSHWHICSVCGLPDGIAKHRYTASVTQPTCDTAGYTQFSCRDCGYTYRGNETPASHRFADTLEGDEYVHWRPAICEHDTERADEEMHYFEGNSDTCSVCGKKVAPRISYALSDDYSYYIVTDIGSLTDTTVTIPDDLNGRPVREIAPHAFQNTNITAVTIGKNVEKIGAKAFEGSKLESVTLGASVESIGQGAFQNCASLTKATLNSAALETLPYYLFAGCTQLQTVDGTTKIKTVRAQAFNGCTSLQSVDLSACTKVEFSAFGGCTALNALSLQVLASAEQYAFAGSGIASANLPALKNVADNMFEDCTSLASVTLAAESIGVAAFHGCTGLNSVTPGTILKTVCENAFNGCTQLQTLALPETVIRVGVGAFTGTGLIKEEGGVQYAANVAVGLASGTTAALKAGTVGIADEAFKETSLTSVTLAESVRFIGVNAFRGCKGLAAVEFKANVKLIGANAFRESGLTSVTVPATVDTVGENAFYDCMSLATVSVSAKEIGKFAFSYTGVGRTLGSPVKERPVGAKLKTLTIGEGVENIGSNAFQYAPITAVTLPETLKTVGQYAFAQTDLAAIAIPAAVTRIGAYAFYGTKLTSATFATTSGWTAGGTALNLATPANNATLLKEADIDWIRG